MQFSDRIAASAFLLSITIMSCAPTPPPATEPQAETASPGTARVVLPEPYDFRTLRTRSNVRAAHSAQSERVATLDAGTRVGLLDLEAGWYQVRVDSTIGWVYAPLVDMNRNDRFAAAMSLLPDRPDDDSLFVATFQDEDGLVIVLDMSWRALERADKLAIVEETGGIWREATGRMGFDTPPRIRFMSNNDVLMAEWHGFWGAKVHH